MRQKTPEQERREQETREHFGCRVRQYRDLRGWTQAELAFRIGKKGSDVSRIEAGKQNVSVADIAALAGALEVSASILFGEALPGETPHDATLLAKHAAAQCAKQGRETIASLTALTKNLEVFAAVF